MKNSIQLIFLVSLFFSQAPTFSQIDTTKSNLLKIKLTDGTELIGRIEASSSKFIDFITWSNIKVKIPKENISEIELLRELPEIKPGIVNVDTTASIDTPDHNRSRMFLFPTGRSMKTGEGYFSLNEFFFPFAAVGFENLFILGGGISIIPGLDKQFFYLSPRITPFQLYNVSFAGGVFYANLTETGN